MSTRWSIEEERIFARLKGRHGEPCVNVEIDLHSVCLAAVHQIACIVNFCARWPLASAGMEVRGCATIATFFAFPLRGGGGSKSK